ncbi:transcription antitermination factor NusB [Mycoplasma sp. 1012]
MKSISNKKTRKQYRIELISVIYSYELQDLVIESNRIFESKDLNKQQIQTLELIEKQYFFHKKIISSFFKENVLWNNVKPLIRAILLMGAFELMYLDKRIVINEFVEITKDFTLEEDTDYKFVNAILDKVSKEYEKQFKIEKN